MREIFVLIDLIETKHYLEGNPSWYVRYVLEKLSNIKNTLEFCKKNKIETYKINYIGTKKEPVKDNEILNGFEFDHQWNIGDGDKPLRANKLGQGYYSKVYFGGASFDACVLRTRDESYLNIKDSSSIGWWQQDCHLVLDSCMQDIKIFPGEENPGWKRKEDILLYKKDLIKSFKINTLESLIDEHCK